MSTTRVATGAVTGAAQPATVEVIGRIRRELGERPRLIVAFASTAQPLEVVMPPLAAAFADTVVIGCTTAGELTETGDRKGSLTYWAIDGELEVHAGIGKGLAADVRGTVANALAPLPKSVPDRPHACTVMLLDPLSGAGEEAVLAAAALLGPGMRMAGGAAGDDLAMRATRVALGSDVAGDAVVAVSIHARRPLGLGACHGHRAMPGTYRVTESEGNTVRALDGRPAWTVWRTAIHAAAARQGVDIDGVKDDEIAALLLRYEAAITAGSEIKVRAPLAVLDDGAMRFACGIPEGTVIRITESDNLAQVVSARLAARRARAQLGQASAAGALVFDCICRKLILGEDFTAAIGAMSEELGGAPLAGFETYGEIALDVGDLSGFHNTTTVVLTFA